MNSLPYSVATLLKCRHFRDSSLGQRNEKGRAKSGHAKAVHSAAATVARCYLVGSLLSCLCVCFALGIALEQRSQTRGSRAACGPRTFRLRPGPIARQLRCKTPACSAPRQLSWMLPVNAFSYSRGMFSIDDLD